MKAVKRAHKDLDVWKEGVELSTYVYEITDKFPKSEIYGLTSQMRRAVISIPSNIAEGAARFSAKEFAQFLNIAGGSLSELDTQIEIAFNLDFVSEAQKEKLVSMIESLGVKLAGLIGSVRKKVNGC
jgi:four helix bundle protein